MKITIEKTERDREEKKSQSKNGGDILWYLERVFEIFHARVVQMAPVDSTKSEIKQKEIT